MQTIFDFRLDPLHGGGEYRSRIVSGVTKRTRSSASKRSTGLHAFWFIMRPGTDT